MNKAKIWLAATILALSSSCASQKMTSYLQGVDQTIVQDIEQSYEIRIQPDDLIAILVNSRSPELAQMFNLPVIAYQTEARLIGQNRALGYLVNNEGNIEFPQLGTIHVEGMTRSDLTEHIKDLLISEGHLKDPVVTIQILNFQVSVIGEVASPGSFLIENDKITIFDALSRAGDLTIYGQRENVKVIREEKGKRTIALVDLRDINIISSPYYYLQQDDVVYVEPNKVRAGQREINSNRTIGTYASLLSVILSAISLIF